MLTGKYAPGAPLPAGSRATDERGGAGAVKRFLGDVVERDAARTSERSPATREA